jgi:hypothetical protein
MKSLKISLIFIISSLFALSLQAQLCHTSDLYLNDFTPTDCNSSKAELTYNGVTKLVYRWDRRLGHIGTKTFKVNSWFTVPVGNHPMSLKIWHSLPPGDPRGSNTVVTKAITIGRIADNINISPLGTAYTNGSVINLDNYSTTSGVWSGTSVANNTFSPSKVSSGDYTLTLNVSQYGCANSNTAKITVKTAVLLSLPFSSICADDEKSLSGGTPSNGYYTIDGKTVTTCKASLYKNTKTVTYHFEGQTASAQVVVKPLPSVGLPNFSDIYVDDAVYVFSSGSPSGGTYKFNNNTVTRITPPSLSPATYPVIYTVTGSNQCVNTASNTINILKLKEPGQAIPNQVFCENGAEKALVASLNGGQITINGVVVKNGIFNPASYTKDDHTAIYSRQNFEDDVFIITVKSKPNLSIRAISDVCKNGGDVDLSDYVNLSGGTFSNIPLVGTIFKTSTQNVGDYDFQYTATSNGCSSTESGSFKVKSVTQASINTFDDVYLDDNSFSLSGGLPTGSGGRYFINNNAASTATPSQLGKGSHKIGYSFTNSGGCTTLAETYLKVKALESAYVISDVELCQNIGNVSVVTDNFGGIVFVNDVNIQGNNIDTEDYIPGTYQGKLVKKNYETSYFKVHIRPVPVPSLALVPDYCQNHGEITFAGGLPSGGEFWLDNQKKASENSANLSISEHELKYIATNVYGCVGETSRKFDIKAFNQASIALFDDVYVDDASFDLSGGLPTGSGGQYLVNNNAASKATPSQLGAGNHKIGFSYTNSGGCTTLAETYLKVKALESAYVISDVEFCQNIGNVSVVTDNFGGTVFVNDVNIQGNNIDTEDYIPGTYQGKLVKKNYEISYFKVHIRPIPSPSLAVVSDYCQNHGEITFAGGLPSGGEFWLDNQKKAKENSSDLTVGEHELRYVSTNQYNCVSETSRKFDIKAFNQASISSFDDVYVDDASFDLSGGLQTGSGVQYFVNNNAASKANTSQLGAGDHKIGFSFTINGGCTTLAETYLKVKALESAYVISDVEFCQNIGDVSVVTDNFGGTVFVNDVDINGNSIDTKDYTPGTYQGKLVKKNYETSYFKVHIRPVPEPTLAVVPDYCQNHGEIVFAGGLPVGGEFWLDSQKKANENSSDLTIGEHDLNYVVTNEFGCVNSASKPLEIILPPSVIINKFPIKYVDDLEFDLSGGYPENGNYIINNENVTSIYPKAKGAGDYEVSYRFDANNGCYDVAKTILTIKDLEPAMIIENVEVCQNSGLTKIIDNLNGGQLFVEGKLIDGRLINSADYAAGEYNVELKQVHYHTSKFKVIIRPVPTPTMSKINDVCENGTSFTFNQGLPIDGEYILNGVKATEFDTPNATLGEKTLMYKVTNEFGCVASTSETFNVKKVTETTLKAFEDIYIDEPEFAFTNGTPVGINGIYKINDDVVGKFNAPNKGVGNFPILYSYTNEFGCTDTDSKTLKVKALESAYVISDIEFCQNIGLAIIIQDKYSGQLYLNDVLITGNTIDTKDYIPGEHQAVLKKNHFEDSKFKVIIRPVPVPTMAKINDVCKNGEEILLDGGAPKNGIYLIDNITQTKIIPENYSVSEHSASFQITNEFGCIGITTQKFNVNGYPEVFLPQLPDMCSNGETVELDIAKPENGNYTLNSLPITVIIPPSLNKGEQSLKYSVTNSKGCSNSSTIKFNIKANPEVTFPKLPEFCETDEPYTINLSGDISGDGVIDGVFYPEIGSGTYKLRRTIKNVEGCSDFAETTVTVHANPNPELSFIPSVCNNDESFEFRQFANMDGIFIVNGKEMKQFFPKDNDSGRYDVVFRAENSNGCTAEAKRTFEVLGVSPLDHSDIDPVCENGKNILLPGGSLEGSYSSKPYIIGGYIRPDLAVIGFNDITFSHTNNNGCVSSITKQVEVYQKPVVTFNGIKKICENAEPVICFGGFPVGGDYLVDGEIIIIINPPSIGSGMHTYEYRYTDSETGCTVSIKQPLQVLPVSMIIIGTIDNVCQNGSTVSLDMGYPSNGDWFINNKPVNEIVPEKEKAGKKTMKYVVTNDYGCTSFETTNVNILPKPEVIFTAQQSICETAEPFRVLGGAPEGGVVTGPGMIDGYFYPQIGAGTYILKYTATIGECSDFAETTITVLPSPKVTMSILGTICNNAAPLKLDQGEPSGGYYSLGSVDGGRIVEFDSRGREPGDYKIWYTNENANGCIESTSRVITIIEAPTPTLEIFKPVCKNTKRFKLVGGYPEGGRYIINDEVLVWFDPDKYEADKYPVIYEYAFENSCAQQVKGYLEVLETPKEPELLTEKVYCPGEEIILSASLPQGSQLQSSITWLKEDFTSLKENSSNLILQANESFTAYLQCNAENGCKSSVKKVDVNVEKINSTIETNFYEVERGEALQLQSNVKCDSDIKLYTWEFSDGGVSYKRNPWHFFNILGANDVRLKILSDNGCNLTTEIKGLVNVIEPVEDDTTTEDVSDLIPDSETKDKDLKIGYVFPNPTTGIVHFTSNKEVKAIVEIRNTTGQLVLSKKMNLIGEATLNLTSYSTGLYLILIRDQVSGEVLSSQKILKK